MTAEVGLGAQCAQPSVVALMMAVYAKYKPADRAALHEAIIAERAFKLREATMLTEWAGVIRAGEVEAEGSQRAAAEKLGVGRRTVRPRNGKRQPNGA